MSQARFERGIDSYLQALDAQRSLASAEADLAASDAALADDQAQLFLVLGGGWQPEASAAAPEPAQQLAGSGALSTSQAFKASATYIKAGPPPM